MKTLITLSLLFSISAFAFVNPQEGNGANVCKKDKRLVTLEEVIFPQIIDPEPKFMAPRLRARSLWTTSGKKLKVMSGTANLPMTWAGFEALMTIRGFGEKRGYKKFALMMEDAYRLLRKTYVYHNTFSEPKAPGVDETACDYMKAGVLTDNNLITILSRPTWQNLSLHSQQILILHEAIRIMQTAMPWMQTLTNYEVNLLTMHVFMNKPFDKKQTVFLKHLDDFLAQKPQPTDAAEMKQLWLEVDQKLTLEQYLNKYRRLYVLHNRLESRWFGNKRSFSEIFLKMKRSPHYKQAVNDYLSANSEK